LQSYISSTFFYSCSVLFIFVQHHIALILHSSFSNVQYQYQCYKYIYVFTLFNTETSAFHTNSHGQIFLALSLKIKDVEYGVKLNDELRNDVFSIRIIKILLSHDAKSSIFLIKSALKRKCHTDSVNVKQPKIKMSGTTYFTIMHACLTLLLYMGISMRLKHVCARGNTFTFLSPKIVNLRIFPSLPC
jgi:hypothetical protein